MNRRKIIIVGAAVAVLLAAVLTVIFITKGNTSSDPSGAVTVPVDGEIIGDTQSVDESRQRSDSTEYEVPSFGDSDSLDGAAEEYGRGNQENIVYQPGTGAVFGGSEGIYDDIEAGEQTSPYVSIYNGSYDGVLNELSLVGDSISEYDREIMAKAAMLLTWNDATPESYVGTLAELMSANIPTAYDIGSNMLFRLKNLSISELMGGDWGKPLQASKPTLISVDEDYLTYSVQVDYEAEIQAQGIIGETHLLIISSNETLVFDRSDGTIVSWEHEILNSTRA